MLLVKGESFYIWAGLVVKLGTQIEQNVVLTDKVIFALHMGDMRSSLVDSIVHEVGVADTDFSLADEEDLLDLFAFFVD